MSPRKLRDESTPAGRKIWENVDLAADRIGRSTRVEKAARLVVDTDPMHLYPKTASEAMRVTWRHRQALNDLRRLLGYQEADE